MFSFIISSKGIDTIDTLGNFRMNIFDDVVNYFSKLNNNPQRRPFLTLKPVKCYFTWQMDFVDAIKYLEMGWYSGFFCRPNAITRVLIRRTQEG